MAVNLNTPTDFVSSAVLGASTKLLPPSSFEAPKGEDPWKALAKATNQIMELRMQNEKLVREKSKSTPLLNQGEEIRARVDLHQHTPAPQVPPPPLLVPNTRHLDELIKRQAEDILQLRTQLEESREKSETDTRQFQARLTALSVQSDQKVAALEGRLRDAQSGHEREVERLSGQHREELRHQDSTIERLEKELSEARNTCQTRVEDLENKLHREKSTAADCKQQLNDRIRAQATELEKQNRELTQLKAYMTETQEVSKSSEMWKMEKINLEGRIQDLQKEKENLDSKLELLSIRLGSMNEILTIQETDLCSQVKSGPKDRNKKLKQNLLTRWREKVFALLVQLKSADVVHSKDELNWEEKVRMTEGALESSHSQCKLLTLSLADKDAQLEIERNALRVVKEELTKAQQLALQFDDTNYSDRETLVHLVNMALKIQERCTETEETFQVALNRMKGYGQRISFASGRMEMLKGQFARKEALLRIQAEDAKKEAEKEDEQPIITHEDTDLKVELDRVTLERNMLSAQIHRDSQGLEERLAAARTESEDLVLGLQERVAELEQLQDRKNQRCLSLSEQLESREAELEEARDRVESLVSDLGRQQVAHSSALEELQRELAAEHTERIAEIERRVNEARREQTKAVVSVRQLERQSARERERSREHLETIEQDHKLQIRQLEQDLRAVESDRNLLMATLRQEGLVGKYKAQRTAPRELEDATGGSGMQRSGQRESGVGGATLQSLPKGVEGVPRQTTGSNIEHTQLKRSDKDHLNTVLHDLRSLTQAVMDENGDDENKDT